MWPVVFCIPATESFLSKLMPSLISGLFGAIFVFFINWLEKKHSETSRRKTSGNYAMLVLVQHVNELVTWEKLISEWRLPENKRTGWLALKSLIHASELPLLHTEDLAWMLDTEHRNLVGEFLSARDGIRTVHECIKRRNDIKTIAGDKLQNYIKEHPESLLGDGYFDDKTLQAALGKGDIIELRESFEAVLDACQATLLQNASLMSKFHAALKSIWPRSKFIRFDSFEKILDENGLRLEGDTILPKTAQVDSSTTQEPPGNVYRIYVN